MVEAHETADVDLFWKLLVWRQHVSHSTHPAVLVLMAKPRNAVYTGLLGTEGKCNNCFKIKFYFCNWHVHICSLCNIYPRNWNGCFFQESTYCLHLEPWVWCPITLRNSYFNSDSQICILMVSSYQKWFYSLKGIPWWSVYMPVFLAIKRSNPLLPSVNIKVNKFHGSIEVIEL